MNTQSSEKKKINWFRTIRPIALALVLVMLLSYATYSWMKRDWTPTLRENNVKIVAGSSLVFMFGEDEITDLPINELQGMGKFVFKSVSNCSGASDDFFALKYSPKGELFDKFKHLSVNEINSEDPSGEQNLDIAYMELGKKYGYLELAFKVKAPVGEIATDKLVKLSEIKIELSDENSQKTKDASKAMRASITVPNTDTADENDTKTIIFTPNAVHKGITNSFTTNQDGSKQYIADDVDRYIRGTNKLTQKIGEYDLVITPDEQTIVNSEVRALPIQGNSGSLFKLDKGTQADLIVRIWLEGEDENCEDEILGDELDILLKFEADDV